MRLCGADHARSSIVDVSGSGRWCSHRAAPRNHECCHWCSRHAVPRNHRCCHWRPRHALSPCNHNPLSCIFHFLSQFSSCCQTFNSSSLFPVAILCTLLHRENTSFEVWYLQFLDFRQTILKRSIRSSHSFSATFLSCSASRTRLAM